MDDYFVCKICPQTEHEGFACRCVKRNIRVAKEMRKRGDRVWGNSEGIKIPELVPSFEEVSAQLRINADCLKQEISEHVNNEIKRLREEIEKIKNEAT